MKAIVLKVREIVKCIKNSIINSDKLRKLQINSGVAQGNVRKLILDVATRWNSAYYMLDRYLELKTICTQILIDDNKSPEMPSAQDLKTIEQLVLLLKPFEFVTKEASGESYVTVSKIIPMINCICLQIEQFDKNVQSIMSVKQLLLRDMKKRFGQIEFNSHIAVATLLDPRFKNLHFRDASACGRAIQKLKELLRGDMSSRN